MIFVFVIQDTTEKIISSFFFSNDIQFIFVFVFVDYYLKAAVYTEFPVETVTDW